MYVGPWQEYKLMRVLADVKAENTRLKHSLMNSSNNAESTTPSTLATPKSYATMSTGSSSRNINSLQQKTRGANLIRRTGAQQHQQQTSLSRPDSAKPESVTSTRSAPTLPTIPPLHMMGSSTSGAGESLLDSRLRNTFLMDSDFLSGHPLVTELVRGAPKTTHELATLAGQRTEFGASDKAAAGKKSDEELAEERARRRVYLSMLYSGQQPNLDEIDAKVGGAKQSIPTATHHTNDESGTHRRPSAAKTQTITGVTAKATGAPLAPPPPPQPVSFLNRNVVRDLTAFFEVDHHHQSQQNFQLPPPSSTILPWDIGVLAAAPSAAAVVNSKSSSGQPAPLNVSMLMSQRSNTSAAPSVSSITSADDAMMKALNARFMQEQQQQQQLTTGVLGAGDAQHHYLKQRPYDYGGPPVAELLPTTALKVSSSAMQVGMSLSSSSPRPTPRGENEIQSSGFSPTRAKAPIAGRRGINGSSVEALKQTTTGPAVGGGGGVFRTSLNSNVDVSSPTRGGGGKFTTGRPISTASGGSLDGDEMAELLSWANNLNPRDSFGI